MPEVIEHGVTGLIVKSVEEAISATAEIGKLSRTKIRERFIERFSSEKMTNDYLNIYRRLI